MQVSSLLLFPVHSCKRAVPFSVFVVSFITLILITLVFDSFYQNNKKRYHSWLKIFFDTVRIPFLILLLCFAFFSACDLIQLYYPHTFNLHQRFVISYYLTVVEMSVFAWIFLRFVLTSIKKVSGVVPLRRDNST